MIGLLVATSPLVSEFCSLLQRVHAVATAGPADLRAFLTALRDQAGGPEPTA